MCWPAVKKERGGRGKGKQLSCGLGKSRAEFPGLPCGPVNVFSQVTKRGKWITQEQALDVKQYIIATQYSFSNHCSLNVLELHPSLPNFYGCFSTHLISKRTEHDAAVHVILLMVGTWYSWFYWQINLKGQYWPQNVSLTTYMWYSSMQYDINWLNPSYM